MQSERSIPKLAASAWPLALVLVAGWALAIRPLLVEWWVNPQYQYGILVPLLCVVLLRGRIFDRPAPRPPGSSGRRLAFTAATLCALLLAAMQPVYEANPSWRLPGGVCGLAIVVFTLALIYLRGGLSWLKHFAFPIAFFLIAVPLPSSREDALMSHLMQQNATATVEVLGWLGHHAEQSGNLIRLPGGILGVEEACSGVRSLRSGIMAALFVGEFFRVGLAARLGLVALSVLTALLGNLLRTLTLAVVASSRGIESVHVWHDPAGMTILLGTIAVVWAVASKFAGNASQSAAAPEPADPPPDGFIPRRFAVSLVCFWLLAMVGVEFWFRLHEREWKSAPAWSVRMPPTVRDSRRMEISDRVAEQLCYDEGAAGQWVDSAGLRWQYFYFRWNPSSFFPSQATTGHNPESCLAGMGMKLESRFGTRVFEKSGVRLPFRGYCFRDQDRPLYVFHAFVEDWERSDAQNAIINDGSYRNRWEAVLHGKRNRGERVVEVGVWGAADIAEAEKGLREFLDEALVIEGPYFSSETRFTQKD